MKQLAIGLALIALPVLAQEGAFRSVDVVPPFVAQYPFTFSAGRFVISQQLFMPMFGLNPRSRCAMLPQAAQIGDVPSEANHALPWVAAEYGDEWRGSADEMSKGMEVSPTPNSIEADSVTKTWKSDTGSFATEHVAVSQVTVKGKTYQSYTHELEVSPGSAETESFVEYVYFCR